MLSLRRRDIVCQQAVELVTDYLEGALSRRAAPPIRVPPSRLSQLFRLPRPDQDDDRNDGGDGPRGADPGRETGSHRPLSALAIRIGPL